MQRKLGIYQIGDNLANRMLDEVQSLPREAFDRYDNPFERKWTFRDKTALPDDLNFMLGALESSWLHTARELFNDPGLLPDVTRHYVGLFVYDENDHLAVHVDAGIHPITTQRKAATALLYLGQGDGDLEFWSGSNCTDDNPQVIRLQATIHIAPGMLVLFENDDYAWHGVQRNQGEPRIVLTASYLTDDLSKFKNNRQRAYFVPRPNERWLAPMIALRDKRADARAFSEAYRVNA